MYTSGGVYQNSLTLHNDAGTDAGRSPICLSSRYSQVANNPQILAVPTDNKTVGICNPVYNSFVQRNIQYINGCKQE